MERGHLVFDLLLGRAGLLFGRARRAWRARRAYAKPSRRAPAATALRMQHLVGTAAERARARVALDLGRYAAKTTRAAQQAQARVSRDNSRCCRCALVWARMTTVVAVSISESRLVFRSLVPLLWCASRCANSLARQRENPREGGVPHGPCSHVEAPSLSQVIQTTPLQTPCL